MVPNYIIVLKCYLDRINRGFVRSTRSYLCWRFLRWRSLRNHLFRSQVKGNFLGNYSHIWSTLRAFHDWCWHHYIWWTWSVDRHTVNTRIFLNALRLLLNVNGDWLLYSICFLLWIIQFIPYFWGFVFFKKIFDSIHLVFINSAYSVFIEIFIQVVKSFLHFLMLFFNRASDVLKAYFASFL